MQIFLLKTIYFTYKWFLTENALYTFLTLKLRSHGIFNNLCSADLPKTFSRLIVSKFIFSQYFFQQILPVAKAWRYSTLLISCDSKKQFSRGDLQKKYFKNIAKLTGKHLCQNHLILRYFKEQLFYSTALVAAFEFVCFPQKFG